MSTATISRAKEALSELTKDEIQALLDDIGPLGYPWFGKVIETTLEQGDIFEDCPVYFPPESMVEGELEYAEFRWESKDLITITQSCDLVLKREKVQDVLFCAIWKQEELPKGHHLSTDAGLDNARKGNLPGFHLLNQCCVPGLERTLRIVDFRKIYSLPLPFVRKLAASKSPRLRLLSPYREQLSQAFARFYMRVGLPLDIPPFKK